MKLVRFYTSLARRRRNEERISELGHCGRAASRALDDMLSQAYPKFMRHTVEYDKRLTTLKNRLSQGRNWHILAAQFGTGILALVPTDGDFGIYNRE